MERRTVIHHENNNSPNTRRALQEQQQHQGWHHVWPNIVANEDLGCRGRTPGCKLGDCSRRGGARRSRRWRPWRRSCGLARRWWRRRSQLQRFPRGACRHQPRVRQSRRWNRPQRPYRPQHRIWPQLPRPPSHRIRPPLSRLSPILCVRLSRLLPLPASHDALRLATSARQRMPAAHPVPDSPTALRLLARPSKRPRQQVG
jgi:hypothetical protein